VYEGRRGEREEGERGKKVGEGRRGGGKKGAEGRMGEREEGGRGKKGGEGTSVLWTSDIAVSA
jgi:hypothetical protein